LILPDKLILIFLVIGGDWLVKSNLIWGTTAVGLANTVELPNAPLPITGNVIYIGLERVVGKIEIQVKL